MNFDYRGSIVSTSVPTTELRTVKKVLHVDSADRDIGIYFTNGEFVVYLPRVYEKVISLRLMSAQFPTMDLAISHSYTHGQNIASGTFTSAGDTKVVTPFPLYFMVDIEGLNKGDETAVAGNRSQYPDGFFAKISTLATANTTATGNAMIEYNDHSGMENISHFSPPIGKLDRLRIRTRLHSQQGGQGFIYWNVGQAFASATTPTGLNFAMTFEIEYLDNGFDQFSSLSTRLRPNAPS